MNLGTKCLHSGYEPKNGETRVLPIYQSTTYKYNSTKEVGDLFDLKVEGHMYSRISNPTLDAVEKKIADLEGGVGALLTTSGQSANMLAILNIASAGDHIVSAAQVYGGTINLLAVTLKKLGIEVTFVDVDADEEELQKAFKQNTKAVIGETIANPAICVMDIEKFARISHKNGVPLIIDNTFATPILCRPFEFGADIVTHSTSKYMDGHAVQIGGVIVDSGNFDWKSSEKYSQLTNPDPSYHGIVYAQAFGKCAYITKARVQLMRDMGVYPGANAAFLLNLGLETLHLRIKKHSENAHKVAEYLVKSDKIEFVNYPTLENNKYKKLCEKYLNGYGSGVIAFSIKGGREVAAKFIDSLKLISLVVHVADVRTCVLHPASSTHRQLTDEQLTNAGITPGLIRLSCGIEDIEDIISDIEQALKSI